ncbi:hypothetical protein [Acetivibrio cellulolyticus]|uniref:hypothetical protein n=1 Tax=Acetivibrio cellulolyticus TaxID=35830 RepID=UPI0001E2C2C9|nr:hypothetical protein [Acetivibrio cellulolyticus]
MIKLKSKDILKKMIDLDISRSQLAAEMNVSYNTLRLLLSSEDISKTQIGSIFQMAKTLKFNNVYEIIEEHEEEIPSKSIKSDCIETNPELKKIINKWGALD